MVDPSPSNSARPPPRPVGSGESEPSHLVRLPLASRAALSPLPKPLTSLVGRESQIASIVDLLAGKKVRLVTLIGPGGVGKTRLALAVAETLQRTDRFTGGVAFVPLATSREPVELLPAIANGLEVKGGAGVTLAEALENFLQRRQLLLVLDNFEHLLSEAPLLSGLVTAHQQLSILVTSRARLRLSGEHSVTVPPLDLPALGQDELAEPQVDAICQVDSVRLFTQRASAVRDDFIVTRANATNIVKICRHLDGLPLAIELAAARVRILPPANLLARLDRQLPLLTGGPIDAPDRLQTMKNSIAWSYDLLTLGEQALFRRLSVFSGGFTLDAAEALSGQLEARLAVGPPESRVLDLAGSLLDNSLLYAVDDANSELRFSMLETIREFGLDQLAANGEERYTRDAHAAHFLALAELAEPQLYQSGQVIWLDRLDLEHPNLSAALAWLEQSEQPELFMRLATALGFFWLKRSHIEVGRTWLERALAKADDLLENVRARGLAAAGPLAYVHGDFERGDALTNECLEIWRRLDNAAGIARALHNLGSAELMRGNLIEARQLHEQSVASFDMIASPVPTDLAWYALSVAVLGVIANAAEDYEQAESLFAQSIALDREIGETYGLALTLHFVGDALNGRAETARAAAAYAESVVLFSRHHDRWSIVGPLVGMAGIAAKAGYWQDAVRLCSAADILREMIGCPPGFVSNVPVVSTTFARVMTDARMKLGDDVVAGAWAEGRNLHGDQIVAEVQRIASYVSGATTTVASAQPAELARLTPRELEILRLLSRRATDKEIATALFISPRTAMHHVASILDKLGVSSRHEAADLATSRGAIQATTTPLFSQGEPDRGR